MKWHNFDKEKPYKYQKCFVKYLWAFQQPIIFNYDILIYLPDDSGWDCVVSWIPFDEVLFAVEKECDK